MKTCTKCKETKAPEEFNKKAKSPDGRCPQCKVCTRAKGNSDYLNNKETILQKRVEYYSNNKERILAKLQDPKIKEINREYTKVYREQNKEYFKEKRAEWRLNNKDSRREAKKLYRQENKERIRNYERDYYSKPINRLVKRLKNRIYDTIINKNFRKIDSYTSSIGCSYEKLEQHLVSLFQEGMTLENYGKVWHVDHNIPISNALTEQQVYDLNHYLNLKPMFVSENLSKNNTRSDICWQKLQRDKLIEEDKALGHNFNLVVKDFTLQEEKFTPEHRKFIERYEWLGTVGFLVRNVFTARYQGKLAGVVMISEPNSYQFDIKYEALIQRGACASWAPKGLNSALVMFSCRWMVANTSKRIFVAYSDPMAGEIGTIYQACNFDYLGNDFGASSKLKRPDGKVVTSRDFTRTSAMKRWTKELNIQWLPEWNKANGFINLKAIPSDILVKLKDYSKLKIAECTRVRQLPKGKYALLLKYGKDNPMKTWTPKPYPKRIVNNP